MTNGIEFLNDMELEERIKTMDSRKLQEFIARQVYQVCVLAGSNERRIVALEKRNHRIMGMVGSFGAFLGAMIMGAVDFFIRR